jgi:hypothetical protein
MMQQTVQTQEDDSKVEEQQMRKTDNLQTVFEMKE